ncbi:MAG: hypothetical protein KDK56_04400 [Simkania sp.]|nr:hypothetical protein [Simkania sp.]
MSLPVKERPDAIYTFEGKTYENTSFSKTGIPMVGQPLKMEAYVQKEYAHAISLEGKRFKSQLEEAAKIYGEQLHEIQGDGNCLTTAFATSFLYLLNGNATLIVTFDNILIGLDAHKNIPLVRQTIEKLKVKNDLELKQILASNETMFAFSSVIRHLARQKLPELGEPFSLLIDEMVPEEDGKEIEIACIGGLCQLLNICADVIYLRKDYDTFKIERYPNETGKPDLVILRKAAHFLSIILDSKKSIEERTNELGKDRISSPADVPPMTQSVTQESFSRKWLFALLALAILGALYYFFNKN